jgi:Tfp pilus assembly protein FimV
MSSMAIAPARSRTATRTDPRTVSRAQPRTEPRPEPRPEPRTRTRAGTLRLTRRGRLVVFLAGLVAVLAVLFVVLSDAATGTAERGEPVPVRMVEVESGDTLWTIASRAAPGQDPRDLIDEIEELNSLHGSLQVGSRIAVPLDR